MKITYQQNFSIWIIEIVFFSMRSLAWTPFIGKIIITSMLINWISQKKYFWLCYEIRNELFTSILSFHISDIPFCNNRWSKDGRLITLPSRILNSRNVLSRFPLNLRDFSQIIYQIVSYARDSTYQVFFSSVTLKALASSCSEMYREPIKWRAWLVPINRDKWSKFGPPYLLNKHGDLSFLLYLSRKTLVRNIQGTFKKKCSKTFFSEESP